MTAAAKQSRSRFGKRCGTLRSSYATVSFSVRFFELGFVTKVIVAGGLMHGV